MPLRIPGTHRDPPVEAEPCESPLGEEFERLLAAAKCGANGLPPLAQDEADEGEYEDGENSF